MRSAIVAAAFAASAIAVPFNKRDVVTDVDVVTATVYATVWADAEPSTTAAAAPAVTTTITTQQQAHYGHHHKSSSAAQSSAAAYTPASSSQAPAPAPSSSEAPASSAAPAPSTYEAPTSSAAPAPSSYAAPSSSAAPASSYQAPSSSAASSAAPTDYVGKALLHHNLHRANHSAPSVTWDDDLAAAAQKISDTCVYAHSMDVNGINYGQNIAAGVPADNVTAVITDLWYNSEVGQYNPDTSYEIWGHFSQMVWHASTQIGCATTDCSSKGGLQNVGGLVSPHFTVCNYLTRGNVDGEYTTQVGPSLDQPTIQYNYGL